MFDGVCEVRRAGITPEGFAQLDLRAADGTFDWNWYLSSTANAREVLAIALAAITTDKRLAVQIADPAAAWSQVLRALLVK
jgi:hypothetical protein